MQMDEHTSRSVWIGWGATLVSIGAAVLTGGVFWAYACVFGGIVIALRGHFPRWFISAANAQHSIKAWSVALAVTLGLSFIASSVHQKIAPGKPDLTKIILEEVRKLREQKHDAAMPDPNPAHGSVPAPSPTPPVQVKLIFKDSPLFTLARRKRITREIDDFRNYLVGLGFDAPVDLPPLDVSPGTAIGEGFISGPGVRPYQSGTMVLSEKMIDDPMSITATYARTAFRNLFESKFPRTVQDFYFSYCSFWFANYFTWSYLNRTWSTPPASGTVDAALWDIRTRCSKPFTDRAMFYAFAEMKDERDSSTEPLPKELTVTKAQTDAYFLRHFLGGENVVDSQSHNLPLIGEVLKAHGLSIQ